MKYVVFDMEWNQTYGRERRLSLGRTLTGEIIEIGAVRLNESFEPEDSFKIYVKPTFYKKLHSAVKRLTGIGNDVLRGAPTFPEALKEFRRFCTDDFATMTWGDSDVPILRENIEAHSLGTWKAKNYNLQSIYMKQVGSKNCISLETAATNLEIDSEDVQFHDAACDAAITAEIARRIDTASGIAEYRVPIGDLSNFDALAFEKVPRVTNLQKLRADPRIRFTVCPVCKHPMEAKRIIPQGQGKKIASVECPEHGKYLLRLRTQRDRGEEESFTVSKYLYEWNDDVGAIYEERLAIADKKKEKFLSRVRGKKHKKKRSPAAESAPQVDTTTE
ncbi:MAG: exonuclease domain-containing protein [Clostridia bacterium]|nr:exonuclease domain-containing protein [Clostridia bacterium]